MSPSGFLWEEHYPENIDWNAPVWTGHIFTYMENARRLYGNRPAFNFMGKLDMERDCEPD